MRNARARGALACALIALAGLLATACGTDEPLPSRTPVVAAPDETAGPSTTSASGLSAFEERIRDATAREGLLVRAIADASAGTAAQVRLAVGQMRDWATGERSWLTDHPADPCYDAAASKFEAALDSMEGSADWLEAMVEASLAPSDDVSRGSAGTEAGNDLQDVSRALIDAAALAKTARANCS